MTWAQTREKNKGRDERRTIETCEVSAEAVCFPAAAQAAVLRREVSDRQAETVHLLSSAPSNRLNAKDWLTLNRQGWGIENGLHQRLDVSAAEDKSRVRNRNAIWVLGMFRRLAVSLFMEWRAALPSRAKATLPDFHDALSLDHQLRAFHLVSASRPTFAPRS